jgi:hypothetical protein
MYVYMYIQAYIYLYVYIHIYVYIYIYICIYIHTYVHIHSRDDKIDDDNVYLTKITTMCVKKSKLTQKCRSAKDIIQRVDT